MPDIGTMHQLNPEPLHIGTMHQLGPEPLHTGEIITPQAQAEEYAREAQEYADNAALSAAAAQSAAETAQQAAESIAHALDTKAPVVCNTASGAIASFTDGADDMPLRECVAGIEPVQDLHGYDNPWPAGGGVNKLLLSDIDKSNTVQYVTATWAEDSEELTLNGANSGSYAIVIDFRQVDGHIKFPDLQVGDTWSLAANLPTGSYIGVVYKNTSNTDAQFWYLSGDGTLKKDTRTVPDDFVSFQRVQIGINPSATFSNTKCHIAFVSGSTITSWTPYSNICPISGFEGLTVTRTGKNMINPSELVYSAGGNNVWYGTQLPPDTDFVFSTDSIITGLYVAYSDDDEMPSISRTGWTEITYKYNTTSLRFNSGSHKWYRLMTYEINGVIRDRLYQLEIGTTATAYEPYQGSTYDITFPSEAGTVYGGSLDVTTGVLTVDRAQIASYNGETLPGEWISDRDVYAPGTTPTTGAQVVYELSTPITYTLTPQEIRTFLGANNIWADTGDVTVGYKADTKLYIDTKFAELQALILEH